MASVSAAAAAAEDEEAAAAKELFACFPHEPYAIQQAFMLNAYQALEQRQIGLFESPTGTGKTLSVICSTLKWLEDHHRKEQAAAAAAATAAQGNAADESGLPAWLLDAAAAASNTLADQQHAVRAATQPRTATKSSSRRRRQQQETRPAVLDEDGTDLSEFLLGDYGGGSAAAAGGKRSAPDQPAGGYHSSSDSDADATQAAKGAAAEAAAEDAAAAAADAQAVCKRPQVIFCSRTHSQLSQFVGELHRTRFADSVALVAVGSRKALCVNAAVAQLPELSQVNERCLELQRSRAAGTSKQGARGGSSSKRSRASGGAATLGAAAGAAAGSRSSSSASSMVGLAGGAPRPVRKAARAAASSCPFLAPGGGAGAWSDFKELLLAAPIDVEELAALGRTRKVCPYYGSRRALPEADVILAPYSAVLLPDARASLGITLQDAVLVFDEAHNLLDAINSAHSTSVSAWQLLSVQRSFAAYYERFKAHLNAANAQHLQQLLHIAAALHRRLAQQQQHHHHHQQQQQQQQPGVHTTPATSSASASSGSVVLAVNDLLFDLGLDNVNMFDLARWVRDNKMAFKVSGYTAAAVAKAGGGAVSLQQPLPAAAAAQAAAASVHDAYGPRSPDQQQQQQQQGVLGQLSAKDGVSAIHSFISFLLSLTNSDADGRIIVEGPAAAGGGGSTASPQPAAAAAAAARRSSEQQQQQRGGRMRYVLLNAARHFGALLASARAVLLVSGTLAPVDGLTAQLFPGVVGPERIRHFECGHVVPASQLLAVSVGRGPSGRPLALKQDGRGETGTVAELGQLLLNLAGLVPQGLVVFVPSFGYLDQLAGSWASSGLWARLGQRKRVFREPRAANEVERVLGEYAAAISGTAGRRDDGSKNDSSLASQHVPPPAAAANGAAPNGALLLCVVGGKLSEGINFGDGLGRCVVVVGLPYPNRADLELQERMKHLDQQAAAAAAGATAAAAATGEAATGSTPGQHQQQEADEDDQHQQQQPVAPSAQQRTAFRIINQPATGHAAAQEQPPQQPGSGAGNSAADPQLRPARSNQAAGTQAVEVEHPKQLLQPTSLAAPPPAPAAPAAAAGPLHGRPLTGRDYYDDLCFKAVNQCVGRVVRHRGDYAAVVLLDSRWVVGPAEWARRQQEQQQGSSASRRVPVQRLPGWLQRSFVPTDGGFGPAAKHLAAFFKQQQQQLQLAGGPT